MFVKQRLISLLFIIFLSLFTSCGDDEQEYTPKPKAYFRIDFPSKEYYKYDSICPFTFEAPLYATVEQDKDKNSQPCWLNIVYKKFNAQLHLSYKKIETDSSLKDYLEKSREFAIKHQVKASGMDQQPILRDSANVFGMFYDIDGNVASNMQFYVTDSTNHFVRASLYFNVRPNIDSLKIVVDFIKVDVLRMINTFAWKNSSKKN